MKAFFTTFPAYGHLLPLLPLAHACVAAGHDVIVAAAPSLHAATLGLPVRQVDVEWPDIFTASQQQMGQDLTSFRTDAAAAMLEGIVATFTTVPADLSFDRICALVAEEQPTVLIAEVFDFVAPLVAARYGLPLITLVHSPANPSLDSALAEGLNAAANHRGLCPQPPLAVVRTWPGWLETDADTLDRDAAALPMVPVPYDTPTQLELPPLSGDRPVVLVTLGTVVDDLDLLAAAVQAVLDAEADVIVTTGLAAGPVELPGDPQRVRAVPFAPLKQLLDRVDAVVAAGGAGTTLAALSRGLPIVFLPRIANQPLIASLVQDFGAGRVRHDTAELPDTITRLVDSDTVRARAHDAADRIGGRLSPAAVAADLAKQLA